MYGTQAMKSWRTHSLKFENDVKMYGTQANAISNSKRRQFENDVKMYGTQAFITMQKQPK